MILVTGATGFVGQRLVRRLVNHAGVQVRVLLRPGTELTRLPASTAVHAMMGSLDDPDSLLAAMDGVHTLYHLIGTDTRGRHAQLQEVDIAGTKKILEAALTARVGRVIAVSRLGADRSSAFPILRAKGEIEEAIRQSGLAYTIFRSSVLFGQGDHFSEHLGMLVKSFPVFAVPGNGEQILQPLWVEDLVTAMTLALDDLNTIDRTLDIGGPELLSYRRGVMRVMYAMHARRPIIGLPLLAHRAAAWFLDGLFARWPFHEGWIEMLVSNQTAELGTLERNFGVRPTSFDIGLLGNYMADRHYGYALMRYIFSQRW